MKNILHFVIKVKIIFFLFLTYANSETFYYSGGCFWCTEQDFEELKGVKEVISGFTGGTSPNPKYYPNQWGDHREAAEVIYNPKLVTFSELVKHVFKTVDYEDSEGQFCDRGHSYSPAIYYKNEVQKKIINSLAPKTSKVAVEKESKFYPVREEHQDYYKKNSLKYYLYKTACGRERRLKQLKNVNN